MKENEGQILALVGRFGMRKLKASIFGTVRFFSVKLCAPSPAQIHS